MDRETVIEMILDPDRRPLEGTPEHREFLAFLEESAECREMYERQQAVWEAMDLWESVEPSAGFDRALYEKTEGAQSKRWMAPWTFLSQPGSWLALARPSFAAGLAGLLLVAGTIVTYQPHRGDQPLAAKQAPRAETEYIEQIDQALDDIEMLADFEALVVLAPEAPGRS